MRPLSAVTLIILGSSTAISISLAAVLLIVLVLGDEYARLQNEFGPLLRSLAIFIGMTAISAVSFYSAIKMLSWRFWSQALMWSGVIGVGLYYWP